MSALQRIYMTINNNYILTLLTQYRIHEKNNEQTKKLSPREDILTDKWVL